MSRVIYPLTMNGSEPMVTQPPVNGWVMSWNPDDDRWYVEHPLTEDTRANFKDRRNALQYARTRTT